MSKVLKGMIGSSIVGTVLNYFSEVAVREKKEAFHFVEEEEETQPK